MKLVNRAAISECETSDAFTQRDTSRREFLGVLANYVTRGRVTFHIVVEVNDAGVKRYDVTNFVDEDFQGVFDVERSSKRARNFVERINLTMRLFDLIVSDERSAFTRLGHVNRAQLNRRFRGVVRGLMLQTESCDLGVEPWQVFEKLFDHERIEVNSCTAQQ